jgi:hypothetical protein
MKKYLLGALAIALLMIPAAVAAATPGTLDIGGVLKRECTVTVAQGTLGNWVFAMGSNQDPSASITATCSGAISRWWVDAKDSKCSGGTTAHVGHMTQSADGTTGPYLIEPVWLAKNPPGNAPAGPCPASLSPGPWPASIIIAPTTWFNMEQGYLSIMTGTTAGVNTQGISVCQYILPADPVADYKFSIVFTWGVT